MTCWESASFKLAGAENETREPKCSIAAASPCWHWRSSSLACFLRCSRFGFSGNSRDITPPSCGPMSAMTGRSEVDVRYYPTNQVGSSLPADGRHPGCSFKYSQTAAHAQAELGVSRQAANAAKKTSE